MWYENLDKTLFLKKLYNDVPVLTRTEIEDIILKGIGGSISIHFTMPEYADNPPKEWEEEGCNIVFVKMLFSDISELSIHTNNRSPYRGDITISSDAEKKLNIRVHGNIEMSFKARYGMIQNINGYTVV
jgi:hypothetical protein